MSAKIITLVVSVGLCLLGAILLFLGYRLRLRAQRFLAASVETNGIVVGMEKSEDAIYAPLVSYKDSQGRLYLHACWGANPPLGDIGAVWPVFFLAADPQKAKLGPRREILRPSRTLFVAGVILVLFGSVVWLVPLAMRP